MEEVIFLLGETTNMTRLFSPLVDLFFRLALADGQPQIFIPFRASYPTAGTHDRGLGFVVEKRIRPRWRRWHEIWCVLMSVHNKVDAHWLLVALPLG